MELCIRRQSERHNECNRHQIAGFIDRGLGRFGFQRPAERLGALQKVDLDHFGEGTPK